MADRYYIGARYGETNKVLMDRVKQAFSVPGTSRVYVADAIDYTMPSDAAFVFIPHTTTNQLLRLSSKESTATVVFGRASGSATLTVLADNDKVNGQDSVVFNANHVAFSIYYARGIGWLLT